MTHRDLTEVERLWLLGIAGIAAVVPGEPPRTLPGNGLIRLVPTDEKKLVEEWRLTPFGREVLATFPEMQGQKARAAR